MAFTPEVKARLSLDNTPFQRALTATVAQAGAAGDDIGKKLQRSFGPGDVFKGLLQGVGIGSLETIVDRISDGFRTAAEQAERIAESAARSLGIYERIFASRRSDEQNLAVNRREQARLQAELAEANRTATTESRSWNAFTQRWDMKSTVTKAADPEKAAQIAQRLAELSAEEVSLTGKIAANKAKAAEATQQEIKQQETGLQRLEDQRREFERSQLSAEDRLRVLHQERAALAADEDDEYESQVKRKERILELDRQISAASAERLDNVRRIAQLEEQLRNAETALASAKQDMATAERDRYSFTVEEVAKGGGGISQRQRAKALEILRLESQAKRQLAQGFEGSAKASFDRAKDMRSSFGVLKSTEQDQFKSMSQDIAKSTGYLESIKKQLEPTAIKTGATGGRT